MTDENVVFFVQEHQRRLDQLEQRTEDLNVIRRDIAACRETAQSTIEGLNDLRSLLVRTAVGVSASLLIFSATMFAIFK